MPPEVVDAESFSPDVRDFLRLLQVHAVRFVIIGGEAVIFYGHIRVTGDIDVFYDHAPDNAARMYAALSDFWAGSIPQIDDPSELESPGVVFQFGVPPNRIDLINQIDGVDFLSAWSGRTEVELNSEGGPVRFSFIGLPELIRNKRSSGRPKDLDDLPFLQAALAKNSGSPT
jgi:hypothetical protein